MWDQPTEPTLVGAPVGHPDGSFGLSTGASSANSAGLWGNPVGAGPPSSGPQGRPSSSAANAMMQQQNMPKPDVVGGPSGWGTPPKQPPPPTGGSWNAPPPQMKNGMISSGAGSGWGDSNVPQNAGGWGAPAPAANPGHGGQMWNGVSNSNAQWDAPNNAGPTNNSWSQIASKNVQNSARNKPTNFEPSGPGGNVGGWGSHQVDQGTPWCNSNDSGARPKDWSSMNAASGGGWGDPHKDDHNGGGHHHHQMGPGGMPPPGATSWQQPPPLHHQSSMMKDANKNDGAAPYWKSSAPTNNNGPPPHVHRTGSTSGLQWGEPQHHVTSGSGWDSLPPQAHRSWNLSEPATPSNVWTGPPADSCVDSSMVWNNPNPKKVAQPDKGTNVWGDPNSQQQQEIRRWKSSDENVIQTPLANAPSGALPQQSASTSIWKETPTAPGAGAATAKQAAPQQTSIHQSSSASWLAGNGDANKNAGQSQQQLPPQNQDLTGTSIWDSVNNKSAPTGLSGWNPAAQNDSHWGNAPKLLDNDMNADDVFSTNPSSLSQKNGLNANYQRMPQQSQSHLMQQHQNVKVLQNSQSMPIPQIDSQTGNKIIDQLKAAATAGLIDANLAQSLIEKSAANNRLAQETVVRMCYILQYLPKLEQAQRELQTIRNQNNPPLNEAQNQEIRRLTNEVNQYQSAVQTLKAQVNTNLASLEKSSSASAAANDRGFVRPSSSANITGEASRLLGKDPVSPQSNVSNNANSDSLNQSKLLQWKNGNSISSNSEDSDKNKPAPVTASNSVSSSVNGSSSATVNNIATSPSMSNLESLVQSMTTASLGGVPNDSTSMTNNDLWSSNNQETSASSNSKRETNSWPKMAGGGDSAMKSDEHSRETTPNESQNNGDLAPKENANGPSANGQNTDESQNHMQPNTGLQGRDGLLAPIGAKNSDEGPPEFRPGQKWLWKDPKEVAEDPNATPGSIKPSSLTLNTNFNLPPLGPSFGGAFGGASMAFNNSPFGGFQSQQHNQQPLFGGFHSQSNNSLGLLNQQQVQQQQQHHYHGFSAMNSLFGNPSNKMNDDFKMKQNAEFFAASRMTPAPGVGRMPPSGMPNQGANGPLPFAARPPMIKPQFSMPNAFVPYAQQQQQWIALAITNCSQIDENHLALLVKNYGTTISYVSPPGSGMAFVKFRDVPLDRILSKMQQEFSPLGVTIQMAKESEVERLLQVFNSGASARQQQPPPMFGAGGPNSAAPGSGGPPPPHHLGGGSGGGMLWDAPPPPVGPWGAAAASFGGPPPNLPLAPPNDPMAQLMQQQLGDGLLGGDRHPF